METLNTKKRCRVLVFNPLRRLVAVYQSITAAAKAYKTTATNIHFACTGSSISSCNMYFRTLNEDIEITLDDLGTLRVEEYDKLCGVTRKYYPTKVMIKAASKDAVKTKNKNQNENTDSKQVEA